MSSFSGRKLRIAYLSADYHRHATANLIAELLEIHDRERFEVIGISFGPDDGSDVRSRLIKSFDRFFDVTTRTDEEAATLIRDLGTHIAVDLKRRSRLVKQLRRAYTRGDQELTKISADVQQISSALYLWERIG